ncbi:MAG: 4Fe-4S cluster-binding domain-containing protein [Thermoguttaceae bacterium]|nr:4Fe-4S cluster-binding domain-containing protein [Thermoguttaceae bacterium]
MDRDFRTRKRVVNLIVTHQCNLNCVYCYEKFKSEQKMDFATAQKIFLKEYDLARKSEWFDSLEIDFFGGEPLLAFDLIRQVVEWILAQKLEMPCHFFVITNGTLLNPEMKAWFEEHSDVVTLGLSFDGLPEMQNLNRSQSCSLVDLDFFLRNYPYQQIKMTVSKETLPHLAEGVLYLQRKGFIVEPSCGTGIDWTPDDCLEYERQLRILAQEYLDHPELKPILPLVISFENVQLPPLERAPCGAGNSFETYDVDAVRYPCHMFTPLVQIKTVAEQYANLEGGISCKPDSNCENCLLINMCDSCRGYSLSQYGCYNRRDTKICDMFQVQCRVAAWFQIQRFFQNRGKIVNCSPEEMKNWKGLIFYQRNLDRVGYGKL